jgi:hypothetical protein
VLAAAALLADATASGARRDAVAGHRRLYSAFRDWSYRELVAAGPTSTMTGALVWLATS